MRIHVSILQFDNALQSTVHGVQELLSIANQAAEMTGGRVQFSTQIVRPSDPFESLTQSGDRHVLFIPAVLQNDNQLSSILTLNKRIVSWLSQLEQDQLYICGCCTAVALMAEAGLLKGRRATSTWWLLNELSEKYPAIDLIEHEMLVAHDKLITSSGPYSFVLQCLNLIELFADAATSRLCAKIAVVEPGRPLNGMYAIPSVVASNDPMLLAAQEVVVKLLPHGLTVSLLSSELGFSDRTLHRRMKEKTGLSPQQFISTVRLEIAKTLLETTDQPIVSISEATGFKNEGSFRLEFAKRTSVSPTMYRARMNSRAQGTSASVIRPSALSHV